MPMNRRSTAIHELIALLPKLKILVARAGGTEAIQDIVEEVDDDIPPGDGLVIPFLSEDAFDTKRWAQDGAAGITDAVYNTGHHYHSFTNVNTGSLRAQWIVPPDFDPRVGSLVLLVYHFAAATVANKDVRITVGWSRAVAGTDVDAASYTTTTNVLTVTDAFELVISEIVMTSGLGALDAGDFLLLRVNRDGAHGDDTSTAAWGFAGARLRYQSDKLGSTP